MWKKCFSTYVWNKLDSHITFIGNKTSPKEFTTEPEDSKKPFIMNFYQEKSKSDESNQDCQSNSDADSVSVDFDAVVGGGGIGYCAGALHVVRVSIGTGILFMPYTLKHLGYILGAIAFALAAIIYHVVSRMVLTTELKMRGQLTVPNLSYVELVSHIFKASPFPFNKCAGLVNYFICVFYSIPLANAVYLVVMGEAIHVLARSYHIDITTTFTISVFIIPLTVFCLFEKILKILVPYSSVTNVITASLAIAIIIVSTVETQPGDSMVHNKTHHTNSMVNKPKAADLMATELTTSVINTAELAHITANKTKIADSAGNKRGPEAPMAHETVLLDRKTISMVNVTRPMQIKAFGNLSYIPKSIAMYIQVFSCTSLLFAIKSDLRKPQELTRDFGIVNVAGSLVTAVHNFFGLSLYIIYSDSTKSNVLENLPGCKPTLIIKSLFCLTVFVSYILTFFARFNNVWTNALKSNFKNKRFATVAKYTVRIGYNLFAFILAVTIPNFGLVSAFAGCVSFIVDIGLSALLVVLYRATYQRTSWWIMLKNVSIIGMCLVLFGTSMYENVKDIIKLYSTPVAPK